MVGPHGGGFINVMFCQPGTALLEMFSDSWITSYYLGFAKANRMPYGFTVSKADSEEGVMVDIDAFRAVFDPMFERQLSS